MKKLLVAITVVLAVLAGCNGEASNPPSTGTASFGTEITLPNGSYWRVTPRELASLNKADYFLACVDTQPSIAIRNTDLFVKYNEVTQNLDKFPADKSQRIVVYCIGGITSQNAAESLVTAGYTNVLHLGGGTTNWQSQGYPAIPV